MNAELPAAVLWDMDGTIIDTEPLWMAAERDLVVRHGGSWTDEQSAELIGNDLLVAAQKIQQAAQIPISPVEIRDTLMAEVMRGVRQSPIWRPGARELIIELRAAGVPCALVTSSYRVMVEALLEQLPRGTFDAVVTGDEIGQGKPHPAPYLAAARQLGMKPADCVVIEDSPTGIAAGLASGARVIGVPNIVNLEPQGGLTVCDSLVGLTPRHLAATVLTRTC